MDVLDPECQSFHLMGWNDFMEWSCRWTIRQFGPRSLVPGSAGDALLVPLGAYGDRRFGALQLLGSAATHQFNLVGMMEANCQATFCPALPTRGPKAQTIAPQTPSAPPMSSQPRLLPSSSFPHSRNKKEWVTHDVIWNNLLPPPS